eukprot:m.77433 g.77433  ORF g.77433 m.77433 type:complete len:188 (-) comp19112_c1_seq1:591-1154(-)
MRCEVGLRLALLAVACVAIQLEEPRWNDPLLSQLKESGFRPATIVDCGANRGDWALWARYLWPDAAILMVEANPHLKKDLDAVVQKVGNAEAVTAVLTESPGQDLQFYFSKESTTGGSLFRERTEAFEDVLPTRVVSRTLDLVVSASTVLKVVPRASLVLGTITHRDPLLVAPSRAAPTTGTVSHVL